MTGCMHAWGRWITTPTCTMTERRAKSPFRTPEAREKICRSEGRWTGGMSEGGTSEGGKERGGERARGGKSEGGTRETVPVLVRTSTREGVKWMYYAVHISRARCCRDDAGLRVSHIYVVCAPPGGCGVRRVECARPVGVPWRGGRWPGARGGGGGPMPVGGRRPGARGGCAPGRAAPRRTEARRGAARTSWGEMPDAARALAAARARAAALSRRAYEAATAGSGGGASRHTSRGPRSGATQCAVACGVGPGRR